MGGGVPTFYTEEPSFTPDTRLVRQSDHGVKGGHMAHRSSAFSMFFACSRLVRTISQPPPLKHKGLLLHKAPPHVHFGRHAYGSSAPEVYIGTHFLSRMIKFVGLRSLEVTSPGPRSLLTLFLRPIEHCVSLAPALLHRRTHDLRLASTQPDQRYTSTSHSRCLSVALLDETIRVT